MKLIKDIGIHRKQGKRGYRYGIFECPSCLLSVQKILKDGLSSKYCGHSCYSKNRQKRGAYKDFIISRKYRYIYEPDHPNATGTKSLYVAEHRLIMEEHLGRHLTNEEVVHHKDENTLNNSIDNLMLCTASSHSKLHANKRRREKHGKFKI